MAEKESSVGRSVSLYPSDWATLHQVGKDMGQNSISGAIRYVLRDWMRLKRMEEARRQRLQVIEAYGAGQVTEEEVEEALLFLGMDLDGGDGDSPTPLGMTK